MIKSNLLEANCSNVQALEKSVASLCPGRCPSRSGLCNLIAPSPVSSHTATRACSQIPNTSPSRIKPFTPFSCFVILRCFQPDFHPTVRSKAGPLSVFSTFVFLSLPRWASGFCSDKIQHGRNILSINRWINNLYHSCYLKQKNRILWLLLLLTHLRQAHPYSHMSTCCLWIVCHGRILTGQPHLLDTTGWQAVMEIFFPTTLHLLFKDTTNSCSLWNIL